MDSDGLTKLVSELGARVNGHPEHVAEVVPQLLALLDVHREPDVVSQIIDALGSAWDETANLAALSFVDHPDPSVRLAVARALPGGTESATGVDRAADALIRLSRDDVDEVRDWATFGLGSILSIDNDEVRAALIARLGDSSEDVQDEAVAGIARRRDPRAVTIVAEFLARDTVGPLVFEAAEYLGDPRLHEALSRWIDLKPGDSQVQDAARSCDPDYQRSRTERHAALLMAVERVLAERGFRAGASLYCDRDDNDVLLQVPDLSGCWHVDSLINRANGDVDLAARLAASDIDAHREREGPD